MRQLSQLEYNLALSIVTKFYRDIELFTDLEAAIGMSWEESKFWKANIDLVSELMTFFEVPKDKFVEKLLLGYNIDNGKRAYQKAKDFVEKMIHTKNVHLSIGG
jgi:hypothetical protein